VEAHLFHIVDADEWDGQRAQGRYAPDSYAAEGFIHLSTMDQVIATAGRHFAGRQNLVVLRIDPALPRADVVYEESGDEQFPHLYGQLNLDAVIGVIGLPVSADGSFERPAGLD